MTNSPGAVLTARRPRICKYPTYATSSGPEAVELGAVAGLGLDDWQQDILLHGLGERPNGRWAAPEVAQIVSRQNGKGSVFEVRELAGLMLFGERFIVHTAHEVKTALEAFRRSRALFTNNDELRKLVKAVSNKNGEEGIELYGSGRSRLTETRRLRFIARSKHSGRGFTCDCLIWDEAYALTDDQVDAQMPALSAVPNPQIWYGSSPPLNAVEGQVLMRVRRRGLSGDPDLVYIDFGVDGCLDNLDAIDLDDRALWYASNPALGVRITEATIERERRAMSPEGFARERLGIWPPDLGEGFRVIPEADWSAAEDGESQIDGRLVFAPAVSLDRATSSIGVAGLRADGLRHIEVVDARLGTGWVVERVVGLVQRHKPAAVVVDEFGPTGSLIPDLEAAGVEVTKLGTSAIAKAYGRFYDAICGDAPARTVRHMGQHELTSAVAGATKRPLGEGSAWDRRHSAVDLTPLVSVTNALYGLAAFIPEQTPPPATAQVAQPAVNRELWRPSKRLAI